MRATWVLLLALLLLAPAHVASGGGAPAEAPATNPPIYIAFLWHMHQPIYWPYESLLVTDANNRYSYSVVDIHNQRTGPYTSWPKNAVLKGVNAGMGHFGAQVSLTGSLIENLNNLEAAGNANFSGWKGNWNTIKGQSTTLGNPRMDLVGFGYHHPLMGLIDYTDLRKQIQAHKSTMATNFPGAYSRGMFPPENAFTPRMIPALAAEGIEWVLIDNIHFDRAAAGYPYSTGGNIVEPNLADVRNTNPGDWVQLNGLWAPTKVSGAWGHKPHVVEYRDPATGVVSSVIAVPADRYMGNEDARGGFGALQYDTVMSQLESYNTDPAHPLLVVLHHDGDNYGGGTDSYYGTNFQAFVDWLTANPSRFVCTTVEDYLEMFPPSPTDVIHVENGSWSGADNGDPEFKKWLGDPATDGYSPDRNSWAVVTAAKNFVFTAEQVNPSATGTQNAWKYMLNAQASDYWYWDGAQDGIWDSHPTRAANQAVQYAQPVIAGQTDLTGPSIFVPQREPYNPGGTEWGIAQPSDFEVWTYVYDVSGLASVTLKYREDADGVLPVSSSANDTYAGGAGVGAWVSLACTASDIASRTNPMPLYRAQRYAAQITGLADAMLDYYVEAVDTHGNVSRSPIQHVWVGTGGGSGGGGVSWVPVAPTKDNTITITVAGTTAPCKLHWGVNSFGLPIAAYRPPGTTLYNGTGPAVETPMTVSGSDLTLTLGPFNDPAQPVTVLDFVLHYDSGTWDNNGGADWHVTISGGSNPTVYVMDGALDASAELVASNGGVNLYAGWNGSQLYVATQAASGVGQDVFLLVSGAQGSLRSAPWAKSGQVADWAAFIGNESGNNWCGWFDQQGATAQSAGGVLEGTINLVGELGSLPATVYIAAARYGTADGGALSAQAPAGNGDGNLSANEWYAFSLSTTAVPGGGEAGPVRRLALAPNPFASSTAVSYELAEDAPVTLRLLDVRGREVRTLAARREAAGLHVLRLEAGDLPAGVYFVHLRAGAASRSQRVVLLN